MTFLVTAMFPRVSTGVVGGGGGGDDVWAGAGWPISLFFRLRGRLWKRAPPPMSPPYSTSSYYWSIHSSAAIFHYNRRNALKPLLCAALSFSSRTVAVIRFRDLCLCQYGSVNPPSPLAPSSPILCDRWGRVRIARFPHQCIHVYGDLRSVTWPPGFTPGIGRVGVAIVDWRHDQLGTTKHGGIRRRGRKRGNLPLLHE